MYYWKCFIEYCLLLLLIHFTGKNNGVEVHFESADSGFFLKHIRQPPVMPEIAKSSNGKQNTPSTTAYDSVLSTDRFTIVQTTQPVSIRASYGPFSTKQTVPARYIVPDVIENQTNYLSNTTAALLELQQSNIHLDISAHLVSVNVSPDSPILRVLFHAGAEAGGHFQRQKICVLLHVAYDGHVPLKGRCMPEGEDGVCVAEVVVPFSWFHFIPPPSLREGILNNGTERVPIKFPQRYVQVSYSVFEPPLRNPEQCEPKVQIQPLTNFAQVPIITPTIPFRELQADDTLTMLMPQQLLYPTSKFHVPVYITQSTENRPILSFTMKVRVKSGIKILSATPFNEMWNISFEKENQKHTTVRVTALRKDSKISSIQEESADNSEVEMMQRNNYTEGLTSVEKTEEVFSWLFEIADDTKEIGDGGKIVWSVMYLYDNSKLKDAPIDNTGFDDNKRRLIAKLEINKDDIQAVLPMAKNWELMNTAVLTGRQVAQAMKVFIVSQGGKVADVTLQSSCHAEDESVIKVSSSCSSVYVDGSEIRGSSNASIFVKYGTYVGLAKFIVWMPEFPLEVYISDFRLSQIKGWRVIDENHYIHRKLRRRKKRSFINGQHDSMDNLFYNGHNMDKIVCRVRYQQSPVDVYARFVAVDQNSGRISYFISRRTGLRVTDLVQPLLRVADPKIANLKGRILQGRAMGRTDVQVLSPITGRVIGAKEVRVGSDKVNLVKLIVRVVSGLQLTITPDTTNDNGFIAETAVTHKLTAQYQEGLLDIDLEFSDGSKTPLRDISVDDYFLLVESIDTEVVAFAPMLASHHPRVIAVGEGNGDLLRVTLLVTEECRTARRNAMVGGTKMPKVNPPPLASALAAVEVDFNNGNHETMSSNSNRHELLQNDGIIGKSKYRNARGDLADIIGVPMRDSTYNYDSNLQSRQYHRTNLHGGGNLKIQYGSSNSLTGKMSPIEVGMYVLLTAFCFAIVIFIISCVVYASKFKPVMIENGTSTNRHTNDQDIDGGLGSFNYNNVSRDFKISKKPTTNAHDWVWLGRSSMDRTATPNKHNESTQNFNFISSRDSRMRITNNPFTNIVPTSTTTSFKANGIEANKKTDETSNDGKVVTNNASNVTAITIRTDSREYRPPVPPHRYQGMRLIKHDSNINQNSALNFKNKNNRVRVPQAPPPPPVLSSEIIEIANSEQCKLLMPVSGRRAPEEQQLLFTPKLQVDELEDLSENKSEQEKHNAEKLVEESNAFRRNVFQFDTLHTPKLQQSASLSPPPSSSSFLINQIDKDRCVENGEFVQAEKRQSNARRSRIKRATVVGNPMFSSETSQDDENGGGYEDAGLSLDDLDMDYEQIMQYFDNLKESNA